MKRAASALLVAALVMGFALGGSSLPAQPPTTPSADEIQDIVFLGGPAPLLIRFHVHIDGQPFRRTWNGFVDRVWKHLDKDADGFLSPTEIERLPPPFVLFAGNGSMSPQAELVAQMAKAKPDRKFTRAQAINLFFTNQGGVPFQLEGGRNDDSSRAYFALKQEAEVLVRSGGSVAGESANDALFRALDLDQDGKLTAKEIAASAGIFATHDTDDDEMLAQGELVPRTSAGTTRVLLSGMKMSGMARPPSWLVAVNTSDRPDVLGARLFERYRPASPEAIRLAPADFARLDRDGNGSLDTAELGRFAQRPPDLAFRVRFGPSGKEAALEPLSPKPTTLSPTKERPGWILNQGGLRVIFSLATVPSKKAPPPGLLANVKSTFRNLDRDKNNYLDRREAQGSSLLRNLYTAMDKDSDGQLFEKEMLDFLTPWTEFRDQADRSCVSLASSEQSKGLFELVDANGDGRLSVRELRQLPRVLEAHDHNKDEALEKHEFPHLFSMILRQGPASSSASTAQEQELLLRRALALEATGGRQAAPAAKEPTAGPVWFRRMDRNRDGDVSRREFLGSVEEFRRVDADGDALISRDEAERFDAATRR
jgi:Ca2+-binding EF-hand superfamily protein